MANMTLTLDVLSNVDYAKIESEVEKIKSNLNKIPQKVTINIDVAFAKSAIQKIESVRDGIEGVVRNSNISATMQKTSGYINGIAQSTSNMGKTASASLREQIDALTGVSKQAKSAKDSADAMKMAWAMQKDEAKSTAAAIKEANDATKQVNSVNNKYESSLKSAGKALNDWTRARNSSKKGSAEAYKSIANESEALKQAKQDYDSGKISIEKFGEAVKKSSDRIKESSSVIIGNNDNTKSLGERISNITERFSSWLVVSKAIMTSIRAIKSMAKESIAVNDSMTQLKIVTNESDATYKQYGEDVAKTAQKIGSSMTDIIDATTTFARLGYTLDQSSTLAELTAMLQKVGDIDAGSAQSALTSVIKAYDLDITDMESVMDKLVTVGNKFPISVSEIATGMTNASSALSAAGNDFDKSVALLAAANTTIQDASKSSTGLRTITARLTKTKSELDDLGESMTESAYDDLVGALTKHNVALKDTNGEYRDTYDIMQDIASVWDTMSSQEQSALAELAAGNRQRTVFYSIIENFDVASGAMDAMKDSAGELKTAYDEWLGSTTAHIETFKAAFQGLSTDLISSDMLAGLVDIGTTVINIIDGIVKLNDNLGTTAVTIGSLVAVISSIKSIS